MKIIFKISIILLFLSLLGCSNDGSEPSRTKQKFNDNWYFQLGDSNIYSHPLFNHNNWHILNLPHDWSIEGKFDEHAPSGIGGGALPGGIGWYRKEFTLPAIDSSKKVYITFDGIYQNSEVYINGELLGKRPNGYITFQYDLTPLLNFGSKSNTIAVRCDNSDQPNSRWYSGSGIYRNVWLIKTNQIHVNQWGTHITTPVVKNEFAEVEIEIEIKNNTSASKDILIKTVILNQDGRKVASIESPINAIAKNLSTTKQQLKVNKPNLWTIEHPYLYKAINYIILDNTIIDQYETTFGIRFFEFDAKNGFILNGQPTKIKGVCNHHDLGALGAALNIRAKERQLEILKEMGCNGIRTSHNPPSPELLDLCDRMGFIVQNETFDVWAKKKVDNDYAKYWNEWHVKDITDHLLRDRNHPSIFSWSIGNEILEQWDSTGVTIAQELSVIVKKHMPETYVTSGLNHPYPDNFIVKSNALDLVGFNYHHEDFESFPETFPGISFIGTETTSSLNSRGEYNMPSDSTRQWPKRWDIPFYEGNPDNTCSSYDNCCTPWGSTHAESWKLIKKHDYLSGMYIWTGFDYLGEPTPYQWPSRSSYFGIIDLAGFPKDAYYLYQSEWTDNPVLHIFPDWNHTAREEIDVWAYTNFDEVELFINGESQGIKSKQNDEVKIIWNVTYQPGELKAIGKNKNGLSKKVIINTADEPAKINLKADRGQIKADGIDLSFITVSILDKDGNLVPNASNLIQFELSNNLASIVGVDNGLQTSMESFKDNKRKAYNGKCLIILQAGQETGEVVLKAKSAGLKEDIIKINID